MFKQIKSILFWSLIYKFRKRLSIVAILISMIFLSQWLYSDIVEYLKLTEQTSFLNYILPAKWLMIFFNIGLSSYLIFTIFKPEKKVEEPIEKSKNKTSTLTDREKSFLNRKLRSEAEILMDKK